MKQESYKEQAEIAQEPFGIGQSDQVFAGGFMLLMGGIFLLGSLDITVFGRSAWWLAALLPVYWILVVAYRIYRQDGRISRRVFAILIWGLLPFAYIVAAPLGLNVAAIWPLGLIAAGAGMLLYGNKG